MKTLIRHAQVVLPDATAKVDVLIEDDRIADIDPASQLRVDNVVDAQGLHLLPGVIDDQVHFRDPGLTHKEDLRSGSQACAAGGVTTFLEMPNTIPATTTVDALRAKLDLASRKSVVNYGFYIGATLGNLDQLQQAQRTPGIKVFIGSSTGNLLVDDPEVLERIFAETRLPLTAHCEDEATIRRNIERFSPLTDVRQHSQVRDAEAAWRATERATRLAKKYRHRFHVLHVSTAREIQLIREHENVITAEACPHHLLLNVDDYERLGTLVQMNPSLKSADDNAALWKALLEGAIQVVATDHAPHTLEEKKRPYPQSPSGLPAVENSLPLMLDQVHRGRCTLRQVVHWMCEAPARVWDIVNKGRIARDYDADLVLVDLHKQAEVRNERQWTKSGWSPWHGTTLTGWPVATWVAGELVYRQGKLLARHAGREVRFDHSRGGYWAEATATRPPDRPHPNGSTDD